MGPDEQREALMRLANNAQVLADDVRITAGILSSVLDLADDWEKTGGPVLKSCAEELREALS